MSNYFLKLRTEIIQDRAIATLPDNLWRRYIELYISAKQVNNCGSFHPIDDLAFMFRQDPTIIQKDIDTLRAAGLIEPKRNRITRYAVEQSAVTDQERKAQERIRERHELVPKRDKPVTKGVTKRVQSSRGRGKSSRLIEVEVEVEAHAAAALAEFKKLGVSIGEPKLSQILKLKHVTPDYINWVVGQWRRKPEHVDTSVGLLVRMLEQHDKPRHNDYTNDPVKAIEEFKKGKR